MTTRITVVAGVLLGGLSRIEDTTGFSAGVSANSTWLTVAFVAGVLDGRRGGRARPRRAALAGALCLAAANVAYYAWIAAFEPGVELAAVAGSPAVWLALGIAGGSVFGLAGHVWATARGAPRVLASLPVAGVCIADGITAALGGPLTDGVGLALGAALPIVSAASALERALGGALSAAVVAIALTGRLEALLP